ncbi:MAG: adenosylcobinamide-GDP ribazoletransferase [Chloroflexi bacterium]|nr:adenosylcobinamide-GDP ribazoletransferase [Chloroflexota bacterium]MCI0579323.1 adenosylcobinamide-GDP ribazoletransferase [Chloroflexota bacterium]MCI0644966.1 adenosylcobinamide-GDP ribazoletransferase [Chloroflexota bacterium]MCI0727845.1 adenosylcobinamide-GDP ribazoletransferase [Chloroflexota bacterium]
MSRLALALSFLTVLPIPSPAARPGDLGRAAAWFPVVGLLLGGILAAAHLVLLRFFPALLAATLIVVLWVALTGGLHLDGLADCCDALAAAVPPARRLEILRDPRLGTFGAAGLVLFLLLKMLAIAYLPANGWLPFLLAPMYGRWLILPLARQPAARPEGMGVAFAGGLSRPVLLASALLPGLLLLASLAVSWWGLLGVAAAHLAALALARLARARLGGVTGDVLGLAVEVTELIILLGYTIQ